MGQGQQLWGDGIRDHSPYLSDEEDRKVMDLSNYSSSPTIVCYGRGSPGVQESVLRLQHEDGSHYQPCSPSSSRGSSSPQPAKSVITSVASLQLQHHQQSFPPSPRESEQRYSRTCSPDYYLPSSSPPVLRQVGLTMASSPVSSVSSSRKKKLPQPIPAECKDNAYWERRKRNNESAKRSRELRRNKERQTNDRVHFLETENLQLRTEVSMLRNEVEKLRQLLIPKSSILS